MSAAIYVYGIVEGGTLDALPRAGGVEPLRGTSLFEECGLTAVIGEVDVTDYEGEALERNLSSPDWLEAKVRGHESVLDEIVSKTSVVPMRFGSIFSSAEGLRAMLVDNASALKASLERVRGRSEWGVKVHCDRRLLVDELAGPPLEVASGRAYLMRKNAELQADARAADEAERLAADVHRSLAAHADEATRTTSRSGSSGATVVLNGAYLVRDSERDAFMRCVAELQDAQSNAYTFDVSGPWPPYNFTSADVAGPHA